MRAVKQYELQTESGKPLQISEFGEVPYLESYKEMSEFALNRDDKSLDKIWLLQHPAVYTQGTACHQSTHNISDIPVVKSDRGGQITYHGPGQIVMYPLLKLKRYDIGVKSLVATLEQSVMDVMNDYGIPSSRRKDAPGVYVNQAKISALGLRIKRGTSYHGISFNIDMDLSPFGNIDPCGYQGLQVTQLSALLSNVEIDVIGKQLVTRFAKLI